MKSNSIQLENCSDVGESQMAVRHILHAVGSRFGLMLYVQETEVVFRRSREILYIQRE